MKVFDREALVLRRIEMRMTKDAVAKAAYCTKEAYCRFESGHEVPSEWWLGRIAKALMCKPTKLMKEVPRGRKTV